MSDSYIMLIRRTDDWMARAGLVLNGVPQSVEHYSDDPKVALDAVSKWIETASNRDDCDSDMNWIPLISQDSLCKSAILRKAEKLNPKWGIIVFGNPDSQRWFALCGFDDQILNRGDWAAAEAHEDLALALAGLKVVIAQERFEWKKDMAHSTNQRDDDGNIIKHGINTVRGKARAEVGKLRTLRHQTFDATERGEKWKAEIVHNSPRTGGRKKS
mgnify:CR=1 FL=1